MSKIKLHNLLFGYRICKIECERSSRFLSKIIRLGYTVTSLSYSEYIIKESDYVKLKPILNEFGANVSEALGLFGYIKRQRKRYGIILSALITVILCAVSSDTIWDIRINGNENVSTDTIKAELEKKGLTIGTVWRKIDKNDMETNILSDSVNISWININRRGSVAYVDVIEKQVYEENQEYKYSNIIAEHDCIIEQISVNSGYAIVKVGDTVKKGDILISGIMGEDGAFCRAQGTVIGRSWDDIQVDYARNTEEKIYGDNKKCAIKLKIFKNKINIFENYGNSSTKYDIISNINELTLGRRLKLPISLITEYKKEYVIMKRVLSDDELINAAKEEMAKRLGKQSEISDILKIRTEGSFTDNGYSMISHISYISDIGKEIPFEVN